MPPVRQPGFAAGEIAPSLHSRIDLDLYKQALKRSRNFFIDKAGAAVSRPGTTYVAEVKDSTKAVRLMLFKFSDDTGYLLEFGHLYVRFFFAGARIENPPGTPVEVVTPYTQAELATLKFVQSGDVLFITHANHVPQTLTRTNDVTWALAALSFDVPAGPVLAGPAPVWTLATSNVKDAWHGEVPWTYKYTAIGRDARGTLHESLPVQITGITATPVIFPDKPLTLQLDVSLPKFPPYALEGWRFYRGRNNTFGFIGEVNATATTFIDAGQEPDYLTPPPAGRNPFKVYDTDGTTLLRTEDPVALCFYEDRLVFGGTSERPGRVFASAASSYLNFDERRPSTADEKVELELASRTREGIRSLFAADLLLAFTDANVWALSGPDGNPVSGVDLVDGKPNAKVGAAWMDPLEVGDGLLFVRAKGGSVMDLNFSTERRRYAARDLGVIASHLLQGLAVVDWTYAEDPWGVVWAVLSDGKLLSLTYAPAFNVVAWAWHDTGGAIGATRDSTAHDEYEGVCAVPEGDQDAVYALVRRTIGGVAHRYIERMTDRVVTSETSPADVICLDSALSAQIHAGATTWFMNINAGFGSYYVVFASAVLPAGLLVGDVVKDVASGKTGTVTALHPAGIETGGYAYATVNAISGDGTWPAGSGNPAAPLALTWGSHVFSGLNHLEGRDVYALVDGVPEGPYTVAGGNVTVTGTGLAHVGLLYYPELETLGIAEEGVRAKTVARVHAAVFGSYLAVGETLNAVGEASTLRQWIRDEAAAAAGAVDFADGDADVEIDREWNKTGIVAVRQTQPLPITIYSVVRDVEVGS